MALATAGNRGSSGQVHIRTLSPAWPLYVLFIALPLWWVLGAAYFIWPVLTFPLFVWLLVRWRSVRFPRWFGLWLLFLAWTLLASVQLETRLSAALFLYRASLYWSATTLFLYIFNVPRDRLPDRTVVRLLALFLAEVIIGGLVAVFLPEASFSTPVEHLVPSAFLQDQTAYYFVHPALSEVMTFLGYPVGRPKTFFAYTNQWGACVAVLMPFGFAAMSQLRSQRWRHALGLLLVLSIVPIVTSLNRGLWLSLGLGLSYIALRLAARGKIRPLGVGAVAATAAVLIVLMTPLNGLIQDRFTSQRNSNETRLMTYSGTLDKVKQSPLIGYGSPRAGSGNLPHLGTQGQMFTLVFSYGVPAVIFFAAWLFSSFWASRTRGSPVQFWTNAALLILLLELPYYNYMPTTLHVGMVAAAIAWRDVAFRARDRSSQPAVAPGHGLPHSAMAVG